MELDLQASPEEIMSKEVELGCESWTSFELFLNSSATDIVFVTAQARQLKQQLRSAQVVGQWRGNTSVVLAVVHGLSGLFGGIRGRAFTLSTPPPRPRP